MMHKSCFRKLAPELRPHGLWLLGILACAFLLRAWYLYELHGTPFFDHLILDLASYDSWGQRIARGEWIGSRVFYQDPLYPYFLGVFYAIFGRQLTAVYLVQIVLGTFSCYLIGRLGRSLFSAQVGLIAAAMAALYEPFIFYDVQIEKSFLAVIIVTSSGYLLVRATEGGSRAAWLLAGFVLGLAVLTRGNYLLLWPLVVFGIVFLTKAAGRFRSAAFYSLGTILVLAPTAIRNYAVAKDWVLTTSQAGQNFFIGNNPENLTGMYRAPGFVRPDPKYEEVDFAREAERLTQRKLKPSAVSRFWFKRSWEFIARRPADFVLLLAQKAALFWNSFEIPDNLDLYYFKRYSLVLRLWLPTFGIVATLGIVGMVFSLREWRRLWTMYLFAVGYFLSVVLFYVFSRYRLPVVPFLMVFAAQALSASYAFLKEHKYRQLVLAALLAAVAALAVHAPLLNAYNPSAIDNLGAVLLAMGDPDGAETLFRQVIARRPDFADARSNLGVVLLRKGDARAALDEFHEAIRLRPQQPNSYVNLGHALLRLNDKGAAADAFRRALELDPASAEAHAGTGQLRRELGDLAGAEQAFRKAVEISPDSPEIRNNLGITMIALGRLEEASRQLDEAVALKPDFAEAVYNKGICLERLKDADAAIAAYRAAIAIRADYAEAYNNLGNLLAEKGDRRGALDAYQAFLRYWKGDPKIRDAVEQEAQRLR